MSETTIEHAPLSRSGQQAVRAVTEAAASGILVLAADTRNVLYCNRRLFVLWGVESHYDQVSAGRTEAETVLDWFSDRALLPIPSPPPERTIDQEIALETGGAMRVRVRPLHGSGGELLGQLWLFDLAKGDEESASPLHGLAFSGTDQARIYEGMFRTNPAVKLLIDPNDGAIIDANQAAAAFYGYSVARLRQLNLADVNLMAPENLRQGLHRILEMGQARFRLRHRLASGEHREVEVYTAPITVAGVTYLHSIVQDVTELVQQLGVLKEGGRILTMIANNTPLPAILDELARAVAVLLGPSLVTVLLRRDDQLHLQAAAGLSEAGRMALASLTIDGEAGPCGRAVSDAQPVTSAALEEERPSRYRNVLLAEGVQACWVFPIVDRHRRVLGTLAVHAFNPREMEANERLVMVEAVRMAAIAIERSALAQRLHHQAHHDELTGLPNRVQLANRLQAAIEAAGPNGSVATLLLDLDDFKLVNDSLGHSVGDQLLREATHRLRACVKEADTVARPGGDEFVLVLPGCDAKKAQAVAQKVLAVFSKPVWVHGRELYVSVSLGISHYPQHGRSAEALLRSADTAMYAAKFGGKRRYEIYDESMNRQVIERLDLERDLRRALHEEQFELVFQPRVCLQTERILGAEALLRWRHPVRGLLRPDAFLHTAEQSYLIEEIDAWVFRQACRQAAHWQSKGWDMVLAVNLSAGGLHQDGLAARLAAELRAAKLSPGALEIEITESMLMQDISRATEQLHELKRLVPGLRVAIDDFGSGYSSLNYLRYLPLDTLKIDRAFVTDLMDIHGSVTALPIIKTIVDLGHNLGLRVVAEGVENAQQAAELRELGCQDSQGFYFFRPMSLEAFERLLQ